MAPDHRGGPGSERHLAKDPVKGEARSTHFAGLDGLRGLAALAVVMFHVHMNTPEPIKSWPDHGYLAVDFFFLLSGFVIAYAYDAKLAGGLGLVRFCTFRMIRLYPLILVGMLLGLGSLIVRLMVAGDISLAQIAGATALNMMMVPVPHNGLAFPVNSPLWSLFFELVVNVIYAAGLHRVRMRGLGVIALLSYATYAGVSLHLGMTNFGTGWGALFPLGFLRTLSPFLIGVIIYRGAFYLKGRSTLFVCLAAAGLIVTLFAPATQHAGLIFDLIVPVTIFPCLIMVATPSSSAEMERIWDWLGQLSYPLYIIHGPVLVVIHYVGAPRSADVPDYVVGGIAGFVISAVLAVLLLRHYDIPVRRRLKDRVAGRQGLQPPPASVRSPRDWGVR